MTLGARVLKQRTQNERGRGIKNETFSKRPEKFTVTLSGAVKIGAKLFRAEDLAK